VCVCPLAYLNTTRPNFQIFCTRHVLWPWLGPPPTAMQIYVMHCTSGLPITLWFHIMERMGQIKDDADASYSSPGGGTGGCLPSATASCFRGCATPQGLFLWDQLHLLHLVSRLHCLSAIHFTPLSFCLFVYRQTDARTDGDLQSYVIVKWKLLLGISYNCTYVKYRFSTIT